MRGLTITKSSDRAITFTREFDAPARLVWDCHTKPELVSWWMLGPSGWTMPLCRIDLRVGGEYRYEWENPDGRTMGLGGVYHEIIATKKLVHTEHFDDDWTMGESVAASLFDENDGKTLLTLTVLYASVESRDAALQTGMTDGMETVYQQLDDVIASLRG
jgi:uncharacterized protein YndB with AHSA1/START domain